MSKTKDILDQIKNLAKGWKPFKFETAPAPAPTLTMYKLKDGGEAGITKLEVGGVVTIAGAPPAAGPVTLEDGTVLTVDAAGVITMVTPAAPATISAPSAATQQAAQYELSEALKTPEGMRALYEKFAAGTPEERIGNLELMAKALMEYAFGWQIREAKEKAEREQAMKVYQDNLATLAPVLEQQKEFNSHVLQFMEEVAAQPTGTIPHETKKTFSFNKSESKGKGLGKFTAALKQMNEGQATATN